MEGKMEISSEIIEWLLEGDVSIVYQVKRDLLGADASELSALRAKHPGKVHFDMEQPGKPSRWNTLRALRMLKHFN